MARTKSKTPRIKTARLLLPKTTLLSTATTVALRVTFNLTAERKREMSNKARLQITKRATGARAKASHHLKERKAKASTPTITTIDTLMTGGPPHLITTERGIKQIKDNGTRTTKVHGPAIIKAKTLKASTKAEDVAGATAIFQVTTSVLTLTSIKTLSANDNLDTYSQSQWSEHWVDGHDLGLVVLHNDDENKTESDSHNGEFYDIFDRTHALISPATAIRSTVASL
jgi:hypothetical protein